MTKSQILNPKQIPTSNFQNPNELLDKIAKNGVDQAEVYIISTKSLKIDVLNQEIESIDQLEDKGLAIRVIKDKKLGFAFTSDFDEYVIEQTIAQAIANAKSADADECNDLPRDQGIKEPRDQGEYFDQTISTKATEKKIKLALAVEKAAYQDQLVKKTEKVSYSDHEVEVFLANSNGLNLNYKSNYCGADGQVIAVQNNEMQMGFGLHYAKKLAEINPLTIGQEAAQKAIEQLGARTIKSQKLPLVLDPFVGTQILGAIAAMLSAEAVQKGKSLFVGKIGQIVGSRGLNIIDNGSLRDGLASSPFDAEGVATQETRLIESGVLRNFLYNTYSANKEQGQSTGNAVRLTYSIPPTIAPTNFYLKPGKDTPQSIFRSVNHGLYVTRLMGIHTVNPISGEFSVGASGIMIEKGQKTFAVSGITIAGNLIQLLESVEAIGDDLRFIPFVANLGSPTILISAASISGH